MKKKILIGIAILTVAVAIAFNLNLNAKSSNLSDITLANVEALANENDSNDCDYSNGYRKFTGSDGGAYDCCKKWRNGDASGDCS